MMLTKLAAVAIGGALGAVLRYLIAGWAQRLTSGTFPIGTLVVNASGCLVVGFLTGAMMGPRIVREEYRLLLIIGLLGGFTTFSTFAKETLAMVEESQWGRAGANVLLSNALCLIGVWIGYRVAQKIYGV